MCVSPCRPIRGMGTSDMGVEEIKRSSRQLRGTLDQELSQPKACFSEESNLLLKFHGAYQQDDRDERIERVKAKQDPAYIVMVRAKIPGGHLTAEQYLRLNRLAVELANGTLRLTSRQCVQFHGVLKCNLRSLIARLNREARITTFGACGDVARNVCATSAPLDTPAHRDAQALAVEITQALFPNREPYFEIWLNGAQLKSGTPAAPDPLYGDAYLPRKFKTGILVPPRNDVDIHTHDLGLVSHAPEGTVEGYTVLAGGGMGMDHGKAATYPHLARPVAYARRERVVEVARALLTVFRDWGDRTNRKHARLKYLVAEKGVPWLREQIQARLSFRLEDPRPFAVSTVADPHGWNAQGDGRFFYGLHVETGRIQDAGDRRLRTGLREIVERFRCPLRITANTSLLFCDLKAEDRAPLDALLKEHGIPLPETYSRARGMSMCCVALPTCGLALSESERVFGGLWDRLDSLLVEFGLEREPILLRMTGCPNGCARPYNADIALVGRGAGKYSLFLGGSQKGDRLAGLVQRSVALEDIPNALRPYLQRFARERADGETFSDWWGRTFTHVPAPHPSQFHEELERRLARPTVPTIEAP